jgi:hypothetical protein
MSIGYENHLQCPVCKQLTIPQFTELVIAVMCQNRECRLVIKKKEDKKKDVVKESKERFKYLTSNSQF